MFYTLSMLLKATEEAIHARRVRLWAESGWVAGSLPQRDT